MWIGWVLLLAPVSRGGGGDGVGDGTSPRQLEGLAMQLVAKQAAIRPGEPFQVGLLIRHATGFHTYWKHPGIVGVPTRIRWTLPPGFQAGAIEWPRPQLTKMAIYAVHGYEGEVLLPVTITPAADWDTAARPRVELRAEASWMCCSNTCHPGFATLTLDMPIADADQPEVFTAHRDRFDAAAAAIPLVTECWRVTAQREGETIIADVRPAAADADTGVLSFPEHLHFFSDDGLIHSPAPQQAVPLPDGSAGIRLRLAISEHAPEVAPGEWRLTGALGAARPWTKAHAATAIEIDVPVTNGGSAAFPGEVPEPKATAR